MADPQNDKDPWRYATYEGAEKLQHEKTAKMTFAERLQVLDDMIHIAVGLQNARRRIAHAESEPNP
jgi:hypothetical protein